MARDDKLLSRMRANPRGDWTIADIERLARGAGLVVHPPTGGSHYKVESQALRRQVVVPFKRPVNVVYVRQFVRLLDAHVAASGGGGHA